MNNEYVGFIGCGNIASAIIGGSIKSGYIKSESIYAYDTDSAKAFSLQSTYGINAAPSSEDVVRNCKYVFLTVKPQVYDAVLSEIKSALTGDNCLIDVAAGVSIGFVKSAVGFDCKVVRVMPNTPLLIGNGASALVKTSPVTDTEFDFVFGVFAASGTACVVEENMIDAVTGVSGSSPAFIFRFAKDIIDCGVSAGLPRETAVSLVAATLIGSARMITDSGMTPEELIKMVSSPNGTTVAGLAKLDDGDFDKAVCDAVSAAINRSKELAK